MGLPNIGPGELIIILVIALVVLGPGKLPEVAASLGKSLREFRRAASDVTDAARIDAPAQTPTMSAGTPASPSVASPASATPTPAEPVAVNTLSGATEPNTLQAADPTPDPNLP
jgi:sec-independent protein translocase protein TatA